MGKMWNVDENEQLPTSDSRVEFYLTLISCHLTMQIKYICSFPEEEELWVFLAYWRKEIASAPLVHLGICVC